MLVRVVEGERPPFQLRKGEPGLSCFDSEAVAPPLTEAEILDCFRTGSRVVQIPRETVEAAGLVVESVPGGEPLSPRLRDAHVEIRPAVGMARHEFKRILKGLAADAWTED